MFARLVTSCQQVWNKLLTICNNLVDIIRLVTRLFQQGCYNHDITILLQPCVVNLVTFLLYHDCIRLVGTILCVFTRVLARFRFDLHYQYRNLIPTELNLLIVEVIASIYNIQYTGCLKKLNPLILKLSARCCINLTALNASN